MYRKMLAILLILIMLSPVVEAQSRRTKLARGLVNLTTGWVEIPKNIYDTSLEENKLSGITMGLVRGLGMAIVRTGAGVYEVVTFPFPCPENYQVILEPEFVLNN